VHPVGQPWRFMTACKAGLAGAERDGVRDVRAVRKAAEHRALARVRQFVQPLDHRLLCREFGVGRTGFEPVTLGLKVRAELLRQTALD
jgi:hypothetical protein